MSVVAPVAAMRRIIIPWRYRLHFVRVLPDTRRPVGTGAAVKGPLAGRQILVPPMPSFQRRILKRPPIGETDLPRLRARQPVDCV
jgi:hypothetical protein